MSRLARSCPLGRSFNDRRISPEPKWLSCHVLLESFFVPRWGRRWKADSLFRQRSADQQPKWQWWSGSGGQGGGKGSKKGGKGKGKGLPKGSAPTANDKPTAAANGDDVRAKEAKALFGKANELEKAATTFASYAASSTTVQAAKEDATRAKNAARALQPVSTLIAGLEKAIARKKEDITKAETNMATQTKKIEEAQKALEEERGFLSNRQARLAELQQELGELRARAESEQPAPSTPTGMDAKAFKEILASCFAKVVPKDCAIDWSFLDSAAQHISEHLAAQIAQ